MLLKGVAADLRKLTNAVRPNAKVWNIYYYLPPPTKLTHLHLRPTDSANSPVPHQHTPCARPRRPTWRPHSRCHEYPCHSFHHPSRPQNPRGAKDYISNSRHLLCVVLRMEKMGTQARMDVKGAGEILRVYRDWQNLRHSRRIGDVSWTQCAVQDH